MGKKMMTKGIENPLAATIQDVSFGCMRIPSPSCNYRTDKKAAQSIESADGGSDLSAYVEKADWLNPLMAASLVELDKCLNQK